MPTSRKTLALALTLVPGIGGKTLTRILTRNDMLGRSPDEFLRLGIEALIEDYRLTRRAATAWAQRPPKSLEQAAKWEEQLNALGVNIITAADAHYPQRIEQFDTDPPGILYTFGNTRLLESKTFTVLSSRKSSPSDLAKIEAYTEENVLAGKTLVSGHDTPEYQRSAVVPLRWGAPRILVLDNGFFQALGEDLTNEPFRAARLWRHQFDPITDLAISCLNPSTNYHRNSNKIRDRLIASLALNLDFVEVRPGGNMFVLAVQALRCGRPTRIYEQSESSEALANLGARLTE